jgi:hypothetical protein
MRIRTTALLFALSLLLIFSHAALLAAEDSFEEMSMEDRLFVRGLISNVYPEKMQISIRPAKGDLVRVLIDSDTILEGLSRIDELEKEQQVKVWYAPDEDKNRAIKIIKMMELGC